MYEKHARVKPLLILGDEEEISGYSKTRSIMLNYSLLLPKQLSMFSAPQQLRKEISSCQLVLFYFKKW